MARIIVPAAEEILDQEFKCLNLGFVRLVDYMGGDQRVVQAARVSYGAGTKTARSDAGLIDHLWRQYHTSPFEQVQLTFHTKMPIFVARQWVRHRTARLNEISGRYSIMKDEFYVPEPEHVCYQSTDNKQGRSGPMPASIAAGVIAGLESGQHGAYSGYMWLVGDPESEEIATRGLGVSRELARVNLPLSLYTEWYWQIDLHNLFHFLRLRMDPHAQYEIRVYADAMAECAKAVAPLAYAAFENHSMGAVTFSADEQAAVVHYLNTPKDQWDHEAVIELDVFGLGKSRTKEFIAKMVRLTA